MKKRILTALLALLLCLSACQGTPEATTEPDNTSEETPSQITLDIVKDGESGYTVIRPEESAEYFTQSAVAFLSKVKSYTGKKLAVDTDWYRDGFKPLDPDAFEILIGATNRAETAEVLDSLPENSYAVAVKKNKLVIVGKNDDLTVLALRDFEKKILKNSDNCSEGMLTVSEEDSFTVTLDSPFGVKEMLEGGYDYVAVSKKVVQATKTDEYRIGQGSASDGTHVYFVLRNSDDSGSVIKKYRLDDGSFVAESAVLDLGHGNDMTYDTKNKRLVVAHGQSEGKILTIVDPETLAFVKDINISHGSGAITYNEKRDQYAISQGGKSLYILDGNFKLVASYSRVDSTGYTAQGMGSDDDFIYFPMSGSNDNKLVVYDWSGDYVATVTVPVDHESESMFWVNGKYYIAYNTNSEALYETEFKLIYE